MSHESDQKKKNDTQKLKTTKKKLNANRKKTAQQGTRTADEILNNQVDKGTHYMDKNQYILTAMLAQWTLRKIFA